MYAGRLVVAGGERYAAANTMAGDLPLAVAFVGAAALLSDSVGLFPLIGVGDTNHADASRGLNAAAAGLATETGTPTVTPTPGSPTPTPTPVTFLNFSISAGGIGGGEACDSDGTSGLPTKCNVDGTFTLNFKVNSLPGGFAYAGYHSGLEYTAGLTVNQASLVQRGVGVWPSCTFATQSFQAGIVAPNCGVDVVPPRNQPSTYTGIMWHVDFACGGSPTQETLTLVNLGAPPPKGYTDLVDEDRVAQGERSDETLTVNCLQITPSPTSTASATPTPTATSTETYTPTHTPTPTSMPSPTDTPTETPSPTDVFTPTATRTPTSTATNTFTPTNTPTPTTTPVGLSGDVNCNRLVDPIDAALILQLNAGLVASLACPQNADVNRDGRTDPIDAALILQLAAGLIPGL